MSTSPDFFVPFGDYSSDDLVSTVKNLTNQISQQVSRELNANIDIKIRRFRNHDCAWGGEWFRVEVTQSPQK